MQADTNADKNGNGKACPRKGSACYRLSRIGWAGTAHCLQENELQNIQTITADVVCIEGRHIAVLFCVCPSVWSCHDSDSIASATLSLIPVACV